MKVIIDFDSEFNSFDVLLDTSPLAYLYSSPSLSDCLNYINDNYADFADIYEMFVPLDYYEDECEE